MAFNPVVDGINIDTNYEYSQLTKEWSKAELDNIVYDLVFDSNTASLSCEPCALQDVENDHMPMGMVLDAVSTSYSRLPRQMQAVQRVLNRRLKSGLSVTSHEVGKIRKSGLYASVAAIFHISDGQSISIVFHAPDGDPKVIKQRDTLIAFRWLMNKLDITAYVAPRLENGRGVDLSLDQVVTNVASLIEANTEKFQKKQQTIADAKKELETRTAQLGELEKSIVEAIQSTAEAEESAKEMQFKEESIERKIKNLREKNQVLEEKIAGIKAKRSGGKSGSNANVVGEPEEKSLKNPWVVDVNPESADKLTAEEVDLIKSAFSGEREIVWLAKGSKGNGEFNSNPLSKVSIEGKRKKIIKVASSRVNHKQTVERLSDFPVTDEGMNNAITFLSDYKKNHYSQELYMDVGIVDSYGHKIIEVSGLEEKKKLDAETLAKLEGLRANRDARNNTNSFKDKLKSANSDGYPAHTQQINTIPDLKEWLKDQSPSANHNRKPIHQFLATWYKSVTDEDMVLDALSPMEFERTKSLVFDILTSLPKIEGSQSWYMKLEGSIHLMEALEQGVGVDVVKVAELRRAIDRVNRNIADISAAVGSEEKARAIDILRRSTEALEYTESKRAKPADLENKESAIGRAKSLIEAAEAAMNADYHEGSSSTLNDNYDEILSVASDWIGAARKAAKILQEKGVFKVTEWNKLTNKSSLDKYLMKRFKLTHSDARVVTNDLAGRGNQSARLSGFAGEVWADKAIEAMESVGEVTKPESTDLLGDPVNQKKLDELNDSYPEFAEPEPENEDPAPIPDGDENTLESNHRAKIEALRGLSLDDYESEIDALIEELEAAGVLDEYDELLTEIDASYDDALKAKVSEVL